MPSAAAHPLARVSGLKPLVGKALRHFLLSGAMLLLGLIAVLPRAASANEAPPHVRTQIADAALAGTGRYTWFAFHVYDGALYAPAGKYAAGRPFALELIYARSLKGADIAQRSIDEIAKLGIGSEAERAVWLAVLQKLFPDVAKNDRLTGVSLLSTAAAGTATGTGAGAGTAPAAPFYFNGKPLGEITDPRLAQAFFAIWLDERTSAPAFRRKLLGLDP